MARKSKIDELTDAENQLPIISNEVQEDADGFTGELKNLQLDNIIQLYCLLEETIAIKIRHRDYTSTVYLENGEIVHAENGHRSGEDAFYAIMALQGGQIETNETERAEKRTISKSYQYLLIEAARLSDENGWMEDDEEADVIDDDTWEGAFVVEEKKLKALVVDDSKFMRKIITTMLTAEGDIEVVGTANDGKEALQLLKRLQPDFVTLDATMPVMDGPTTLKHIMIKKPCPVIIMSNLTSDDHNILTKFFNLGAVDFMPKPVKNKNVLVQQQQILSRARSAAKARIIKFRRYTPFEKLGNQYDTGEEPDHKSLVVFISGPGGYLEMLHILSGLPGARNTYFAAFQSLPEELTESFSTSAGKHARLSIVPVNSKRNMEPGRCYIASLESDVLFQKNSNDYYMLPDTTSCHRKGKLKAIDKFICSAAENFTGTLHVALLSGVEDIADSSLDTIHNKGGKIIVQDPSSCMMPHFLEELISKDIADAVASPEDIVREALALVSKA